MATLIEMFDDDADDDDDDDDDDDNDVDDDYYEDDELPHSETPNERRDRIAGEMWEQYQRYL